MPPALDRLLASPSALGLLRCIVNSTASPTACRPAARCSHCTAHRRGYRPPRGKVPLVRFRDTPRPKISKDHQDDHLSSIAPIGTETEPRVSAASWAEYLQQRERVGGLRGIREVWAERCKFDLPTDDTPDAEYLWGTFIRAPDLVVSVIEHAVDLLRRTGRIYPHLYELCMGYWLPQEQHIEKTLNYHHQLVVRLKLQKLPLRTLAHFGKQRWAPNVYNAFMDMYRTSNERNVYDEVVPVLCARGSVSMAQHWHTLCTRRGDCPSLRVAAEPAIQALNASIANLSDPEARLLTIYVRSLQKREPKLNADLLRRLQGRDSAPVRFDDAFCARMFATRTFPPESIIKGLAMVGVNEIGPQAVRAMASRTSPISELVTMFEELRANGITLQGSVFSIALEKFAQEKRWSVVQNILESDQHPEVYDDTKLQKELLDYYIQQQDLKQAHRTLAILSVFHNDASHTAWNLLLQAQIKQFDPGWILHILQTMRIQDIDVNTETLMAIKAILRPRQHGRKPGRSPRGKFDDLRFVTRLFFMILECGMGNVRPAIWSEILRRYGMSNRFRELRRTVLRLFCWYAPRTGNQFRDLPKPPSLDSVTDKLCAGHQVECKFPYYNLPPFVTQKYKIHPLRGLFPPRFQQALIVWGFRQGLLPNAPTEQSMFSRIPAKIHHRRRLIRSGILRRLDWSVGLQLLVELRDLGLDVHRYTVVKALQAIFVNTFGRGQSNKTENRRMEAANRIPYPEYVREVNRIWGKVLFGEPHLYVKDGLHKLMWHPRFPRYVRRRSYLNLDEVLGPIWREQKSPSGVADTVGHEESEIGNEHPSGTSGSVGDSSGLEELERSAMAQRLSDAERRRI
ncbi:hypothetical protein P280DRAFT_415852 [Massarina eburnea CBS 473.64]|uniref:Pentatricopeptide repeat domain-containing protein n=1 Tax=Massarina eburnea CBS 473.64 TaxID=1395130 RepID=A0A6A6SGQ4_9PLEO|nr:hypothetical protein P280DRAFT_415852 [Massarina eburnea CBS 473.64]